ncbi:MAG: phosphotyrosine protein phosphatase [Lachnospiraceae bacterium]|nr:phosphotyrosine protein phosphatase [Lachnospiraceae bacterium]
MKKEYKKLIFVDTDNTCRSIMAEAVMKAICKNKPITVCSRGLVVLFPEPINPKATAILKGDGLVPAKTGTEELLPEDLTEDTLVLTMTAREKKKAAERLGPKAEVHVLAEFSGAEGEVEEPHGGTLANYGACYEYIDFLVKVAYEKIYNSEEE